MIILDTAGDTIQAEASGASSITVKCYGVETASGTDTYKRLGTYQLTGSGTQDTIYTVPADTVTICSVIVIANTSIGVRTVNLWDVENGGSPGDANAILSTIEIAAKTTIVWNKGNIQVTPAAWGRQELLILTPQCSTAPAASFATLDTITGGSTPAETIPVLDFDADTSEYIDFKIILPAGYASGGLTVTVIFSMTSDHDEGTPHKVRWEVAFARISDDDLDMNGDQAYDFNGVSAIVPSVVGEVSYDNITFTNGADMDSLAAGEMAILRIYRDHDHADDNATGDAELQMIQIKET